MFADSTFLIDLLRGDLSAVRFVQEVTSTPICTSEINVFELIVGAYYGDWDTAKHLEKVFALLGKMTVLPLDRKATIKAGILAGMLSKEGKKIGEIDCLIAGVALAHGMTRIITKNKEHFSRIPELTIVSY